MPTPTTAALNMKARKCLALAVSELTLDNLDASATAAKRAGELHFKVSPLVCDVEIFDVSQGVRIFLMSYVVDGWNAMWSAEKVAA